MIERELRRKLTFRAHGSTLVLIKRPIESIEHVWQKALLWALYLPSYPDLRVEVPLPGASRYKPDLLAFEGERPRFWGECGVVALDKLDDLLRRYRSTHLVFSKWQVSTQPFAASIERALRGVRRSAAVELIRFPAEAAARIAENGEITIAPEDVERRRWD
jgi:hypothetical protein